VTGQWFPLGTPVSSTNKTDRQSPSTLTFQSFGHLNFTGIIIGGSKEDKILSFKNHMQWRP
jgi:hypothetical protein